jgi:hypothetical protein
MSEFNSDTFNNEVPDESEQLDQIQSEDSLEDRGVDDVLDEGYTTAENYSPLIREGEHETLDERLAEEIPEPDPYAEPDDGSEVVPGDWEVLDDGEVGDKRAGRLVDVNQGIGPDWDKDMVGADVGIDGAAASAEEAAMHIVPDDRS